MSQQNQLEPTGFTTRTIHAVHDARYDASVPPVHTADFNFHTTHQRRLRNQE